MKTIIFDLDGTLLDTSKDIQKLVNECLNIFSLPPITLDETISFIGDGARALIERACKQKTEYVDSVLSCYLPKFSECDNKLTTFFDGEKEFLLEAKSKGYKLAICTNKPQKTTNAVVNQFFKQFEFDIFCGFDGVLPLKPNPTSTLKICEKLGTSPHECIFVGDGETDILTAKNAGIISISALWGYREKELLSSFCPDYFVTNFKQLGELIFSM